MIFKDIPGYEGSYQISDCGQVKSLERIVRHSGGGNRLLKEKIIKPILDKYGVKKNYKVHRLVMYTHSHVDDELTVNHIDENKRNNHISNLEYCTHTENIKKYHKNNPEKAAQNGKKGGKIGAKATKERFGHKYLDTHTGIVYASAMEVGVMMHEIGQGKTNWVWRNILRDRKPQDRFVRVYNESK
jgi:hypothetical protein